MLATDAERPELLSKITSLVQQFAPSALWQVDTLLAVLQVSGKYANEEVASALISIIGANEEELAAYTVGLAAPPQQTHRLFRFLQQDLTQVSLTQVAVWFIGEYGEELLAPHADARGQQLAAVSETAVLDLLRATLRAPTTDAPTRGTLGGARSPAMVLTALVKLADRFGAAWFPQLRALLAPSRTALCLQAQQRACEYTELLAPPADAVRETLLDRMPPLDLDTAKARRAEEDDADTDADEAAQ